MFVKEGKNGFWAERLGRVQRVISSEARGGREIRMVVGDDEGVEEEKGKKVSTPP